MSGIPQSLGLEIRESIIQDGEQRDVVPAGCYGENILSSLVKGLVCQ